LLAISFRWKEIKCVAAIELAASRYPPDICIYIFKSGATAPQKKKDIHSLL